MLSSLFLLSDGEAPKATVWERLLPRFPQLRESSGGFSNGNELESLGLGFEVQGRKFQLGSPDVHRGGLAIAASGPIYVALRLGRVFVVNLLQSLVCADSIVFRFTCGGNLIARFQLGIYKGNCPFHLAGTSD